MMEDRNGDRVPIVFGSRSTDCPAPENIGLNRQRSSVISKRYNVRDMTQA